MNWEAVLFVFVVGFITALATGVGALPFAFVRGDPGRMIGVSDSIAAGLMLGASFGLLVESGEFGVARTLIGALAGVGVILVGEKLVAGKKVEFLETRSVSTPRVFLFLAVMTIHSFSEGVAIGVSYGGGEGLATMITVAIAVHNIPEGLAITAVLRPQGASLWSCARWSVFSSLPQPLMAVPAFLFVDAFRPILPYGLGFAAGAMIYMVFLELLPEAYERSPKASVGLWVSLSFGAMTLFQAYV